MDDYDFPKRPLSIWLSSIWSLSRAAAPILTMIGLLRIYELYGITLGTTSSSSGIYGVIDKVLVLWTNSPTISARLSLIIGFISIVGFLYAALGIFLGHSWARSTFFILSISLVLWNARLVPNLNFSPFLRSSIALSFSIWYFRKPLIQQFFGDEWNPPDIFTKIIFGIPLDLGLTIILLAILTILSFLSLIGLWDPFSARFWL